MQVGLSKKKSFILAFIILILSGQLLIYTGCRKNIGRQDLNTTENKINQISGTSDYPDFIKYRSFQNPDSTWGFTVLVNSRPFLHYKKIPINGSVSGFLSKGDAEKVAGLFVKKMRDGYPAPKLNKRTLDSLGIQKNITK